MKPTIQELYDNTELTVQKDKLMVFLNQEPPSKWIQTHPYIRNYKYLPIEKIEFLLKRIFKTYKIEVKNVSMLLNSISVSVRVHYNDPLTGDWMYHDGVGACEIQTKKDTGNLKLDMTNINRGAVTMALPIAKTVAVKDACDHFGKLFGCDLNRKDTMNYTIDEKLESIDMDKIKKGAKL